MTFFEQFPPQSVPDEPEPVEPPEPVWAKPETTLGAAVPGEFVLARGADAVVGLNGLVAFPNGFTFSVTALLARADRRGRVFQQAFHPDFDQEPLSPEFLRLGVQFADGGAATNLGFPGPPPGTEPTGPLLLHNGGGGGGRRYEMSYWVWPLPPPGPVTVICEWPSHGIAESRVVIEADLIVAAAARAIPLEG